MDRLNSDCIASIAHYLTLQDQITMSRVSNTFLDALCSTEWRKDKYRNFRTQDDCLRALSKEDYQYFLEQISPAMKELHIGEIFSRAFSSYLGRHLLRPELAFYLRLNFCNLREFHCEDDKINDSMIRTLSSFCPELHVLDVTGRYITGKFIYTMSKLKTLRLHSCSIEENYLLELLYTLKQLQQLKIIGNRHNVENLILKVPFSVLPLKELCISDARNFGLHLAAKLPKLEELTVYDSHLISETKLEQTLAETRKSVMSGLLSIPKNLRFVKSSIPFVAEQLQQLCKVNDPQEDILYLESTETLIVKYIFSQ
ncbi:uncharacterized protein LOC115629033 [Scaptodrosophila lebanonensis]|uniref:Uncharacterized protein LOC115629033 n=1 Tax=Drosophila lebanonensis TaxID=7225 RepID=A0A6J2TZV9_DROLE|nr:uncharacterized protein LOC115629033 [Scaptodrosophila lebanonensis]